MITWLLFSPMAVLAARLGRRWSWFKVHAGLQVSHLHSDVELPLKSPPRQLIITVPLTCIAVIIGAVATAQSPGPPSTDVDAHHVRSFKRSTDFKILTLPPILFSELDCRIRGSCSPRCSTFLRSYIPLSQRGEKADEAVVERFAHRTWSVPPSRQFLISLANEPSCHQQVYHLLHSPGFKSVSASPNSHLSKL